MRSNSIPRPNADGERHALHLYVVKVRLDRLRVTRDRFVELLREENVGAGIHYAAVHLHPFYRDAYGWRREDFPNAAAASQRVLTLPGQPGMSDDDVAGGHRGRHTRRPSKSPVTIELSAIDRERFGYVTARAFASDPADVARCDGFCAANGVQLLIVRCSTDSLTTVHAFEDAGARLMDCMVRYRCDLRKHPVHDTSGVDWIRTAQPGDAEAIARVAARAFSGYEGHYHADPRLRREDAAETYRDWAARSCADTNLAEKIFVASAGDTIAGFVTLRRNSDAEMEAVLLAIAPEAQGSGVPYAMGIKVLRWSADAGARRLIVTTQVEQRRDAAYARAASFRSGVVGLHAPQMVRRLARALHDDDPHGVVAAACGDEAPAFCGKPIDVFDRDGRTLAWQWEILVSRALLLAQLVFERDDASALPVGLFERRLQALIEFGLPALRL